MKVNWYKYAGLIIIRAMLFSYLNIDLTMLGSIFFSIGMILVSTEGVEK